MVVASMVVARSVLLTLLGSRLNKATSSFPCMPANGVAGGGGEAGGHAPNRPLLYVFNVKILVLLCVGTYNFDPEPLPRETDRTMILYTAY